MGASMYTTVRSDLFRSGGAGAQGLVNIPAVDALVGKSGLAVYDSVGLQLPETVQYFLTFDDVTKFIHFGKGVGTVQVEGTMYSDCDAKIPGTAIFRAVVSALRGRERVMIIGGVPVEAILTNSAITVLSEPDTMAHFSFTFSVVNHLL
jgi:hypothetical protein